MDGGESILEAIYEEDDFDNVQDVDMLDIEEGECVDEQNAQIELGQSSGDVNAKTQETCSRNRRRRGNKKNKKRKNRSTPNITDINRFVLDTCKRLKERKTYLVYTAVGCLGVSALSDLVKEVDAIQACGGQMTADGRRCRTGGGILWSILKARDPNAFKEIMQKGKEFEKQFKQINAKPAQEQKENASQRNPHALSCQIVGSISDGSEPLQNQAEQHNAEDNPKRVSVHDRIRVPIIYDDLFEDNPRDESI